MEAASAATTRNEQQQQQQERSEDVVVMKIFKRTEDAVTPIRASFLAAGFDLFSAISVLIPPKSKALIPTDLSVAIPVGCYGRIAARSGLALKHHIDVGAGVIDADYRGNVGIVLFNHSYNESFQVKKGDRVAQLICEKIAMPILQECNTLEELSITQRGVNGFGSTDI